jgi:predicted dehydrogenase
MVRTGLIGLGKMGLSHCSILGALADVELAGICDTSKIHLFVFEKYAPFPVYSDYKRMLSEARLDCLFIATPTRFHADMAHYAMDRGVSLFVEKPLCLTAAEGRALADKAKATGIVSQVGYHNRFIGTFREVKRLLERGVIGEVYHCLGEAYGPVVLKEKGGTWRSVSTEGGGCLYDYASHVVNLLNFYFGLPEKVMGTILKNIYSQGVDDAVYSTLLFPGGLSGHVAVNWSDESYRKMSTQVTILGKKGKIVCDAQELKIYLREDNPAEGLVKGWNVKWLTALTPPVGFYLRGEEYTAQVEYFIDCVKNRRPDNLNSFASALQTTLVIDEMLQDCQA